MKILTAELNPSFEPWELNPEGVHAAYLLYKFSQQQAQTEHDDQSQTLSLSCVTMTYKYSTKKQRESEKPETRQVHQSSYYYMSPQREKKIYCTKVSGGPMLRP